MSSHTSPRRLYFDQAATTWPKLPAAIDAAMRFMEECGATAGRGAYASARHSDYVVAQARQRLAKLVGAPDANSIAFASSGTHALNAILFGLIEPTWHVMTTAIEHNSVLRPLEHLRQTAGLHMSYAKCDSTGLVDLQHARDLASERRPDALVISHASNVTGRLQNLHQWRDLAREYDALLMVDASQTIGYVPVDMANLGIDVLASAGHKGLGALAGTGFVAIASSDLQKRLHPILFGGTGSQSEHVDAVPQWPQSIEVGNLNLPAVASMSAAADYWLNHSEQLMSWRLRLDQLLEGLFTRVSGSQISVVGHGSSDNADSEIEYVPIVSVQLATWDIHEAAAVLDANFGIEARAGYHCAAMIHKHLGSSDSGGTLRFSLGHQSTEVDVEELLHALVAITG